MNNEIDFENTLDWNRHVRNNKFSFDCTRLINHKCLKNHFKNDGDGNRLKKIY